MGEISLKAVVEEENTRTFHIGLSLGEEKAPLDATNTVFQHLGILK